MDGGVATVDDRGRRLRPNLGPTGRADQHGVDTDLETERRSVTYTVRPLPTGRLDGPGPRVGLWTP